jgi:hypothetical protein
MTGVRGSVYFSIMKAYKKAIKVFLFSSLLILLPVISSSQILKNEVTLDLVKDCADCIYDLKFTEANDLLDRLSKYYPDHPALDLIKGMIIYWQNFPLTSLSPERKSFEEQLKKSMEKCNNIQNTDEAEILLTNLCSRGLLLLFYSDNRLSWEVMPLAAGTYKYVRRAFSFRGAYPDYYYFTGLYNYYREAYPEAHPIYKSFVFIFPRGDKASGLKDLKAASENSIFLKAESLSFLSYIYLNFEKDENAAAFYTKKLHDRYPANRQFLLNYIKSLLLEKKYDEAETNIKTGYSGNINMYFRAGLEILEGILNEKKYRNADLAEKLYMKGLNDMKPYSDYGNDFEAYAYFGLSRISAARGDVRQQKNYRDMANGLTDYRDVNFDN